MGWTPCHGYPRTSLEDLGIAYDDCRRIMLFLRLERHGISPCFYGLRFMLPLDVTLALDTLTYWLGPNDRAPMRISGKIMHELRGEQLARKGTFVGTLTLYYGTIDATELWIIFARRGVALGCAGAGRLRRCCRTLRPQCAIGVTWRWILGIHRIALVNAWKDSGRSGTMAIADGPIALCEVQGTCLSRVGADCWRARARMGG